MKPMLAAKPDPKLLLKDLDFSQGLLASFKFDGIRALNDWGTLKVRRLTPVKNRELQQFYGLQELHGLDGELYVPPEVADFHTVSGCVRAKTHPLSEKIVFHAFDCFRHPRWEFERRLAEASEVVYGAELGPQLQVVQHQLLRSLDDFYAFEEQALRLDFEGVCLRKRDGPYKFGRSTMREHWLIKVKRFSDAECKVIGFEEQMENRNEATTDALGKTKRSRHQENLVGKDTLGALVVVGLNGRFKGVEFRIAGGSKQEGAISFDDAFRKEVWQNQKKYKGRIGTYTYFEPGSKDAPRHAGLFRWRDGML